jgi:uncharacterized membrane protein
MSLYVVLSAFHLIGLIFGLGGVTATDIVSAYGMHINPKMMPKVVSLFKALSFMIWVGLFLLIASGIGLWLTSADIYGANLSTWQFYLKLGLTGLAALNGLFLNIIVTPMWENVVELENFRETKEYRIALFLGFISGGLSFASWWCAFGLGIWVFRILG